MTGSDNSSGGAGTTGSLVGGTRLAQHATDLVAGAKAKVKVRTERTGQAADRLAVRLEMIKMRVLPSSMVAGRVQPGDDPDGWRFLRRPALLGFLALVSICLGASLPSSPFKLEMAGTWFFGEPAQTPGSSTSFMLFGLVAVYGGLVLLMRVWYGLMKALARRPGVPVKYLVWILILWTIPVLIVAPIFSRDVYSYAAQGELMSRHINPYHYGPFTLGSGPYVKGVDPLWGNTPAPYGPLFLMMDGLFASLSFHHVLGTIILLRLSAVLGVALIAICIPMLAKAYGKDHGSIYVLAVLNPLVTLTLVGSGHNDALMVGLLLCGVTAAKLRHPVWGAILCALAASIKVPAAIGILYVGWDWLGTGLPWRQRVKPVAWACGIGAAVVLVLSAISGLGLGWIGNLATPGTVRSWLAPATGIGMGLTNLAHAVGLNVSQGSVLSITRVIGLMAAAAISLYLLLNSDRYGALKAMGISLLLFVVLGPVVQPWYLTWGVILLAPVAVGRLRTVLLALSVLSPFIGLPGGRILLDELIHYNPIAVAGAFLFLLGVLVVPIGRWSSSWRAPLLPAMANASASTPAAASGV